MHDIKFIREHPEAFDKAMKTRGIEPCAEKLLEMDRDTRGMKAKIQELQHERKDLAKEIGKIKAKTGEIPREKEALGRDIHHQITALEKSIADDQLVGILESLPNMPDEGVPEGVDESFNQKIKDYGDKPSFDFDPKPHWDLGESLGILDFEHAAKVSGSRFSYFFNELSLMERALSNFMLDMHTREFGYTEVSPPFLTHDDAMYGAGQLPKFAEDSFETTNGYRLIPTSEVPLVNWVRERILLEEELPLRLTAFTPCFRSEAGSHGKDTRGLIRQHQFSKVELVSITTPDQAHDEHERMLHVAEQVLARLGLAYQVVVLSSGDMGFSAQKTYDLEVWLPAQKAYREISSVSHCGAFQARRMRARYRPTGSEKQTEFVHTLNGSALAVGRTLVAILENYQQADGSITIPHVLRPYMHNMEVIQAIDSAA